MGHANYFKKGDWSAICDRCGFQFHASEMRKTWDGLYVDKACFEPRHPQDFVRGIPDPQAPPWTRPDHPDQFITTPIKASDL